MARRLRARAKPLGRGSAPGLLYDLDAYPGAFFGPEHRQRVLGEVFALPVGDPLLRAIDVYEGCSEDGSATNSGFERLSIIVTLDTGRQLEAWSYGLRDAPRPARPIPSGDWIAHLAARKLRAARR
jgi:gamma-glutamylcyclotransferase (GGCT)/AIG2-like uncharacterized protein YtfP